MAKPLVLWQSHHNLIMPRDYLKQSQKSFVLVNSYLPTRLHCLYVLNIISSEGKPHSILHFSLEKKILYFCKRKSSITDWIVACRFIPNKDFGKYIILSWMIRFWTMFLCKYVLTYVSR